MIYEINTWVWLGELSRKLGKPVDLATVPEPERDAIASHGFDAVWFMGVWERSPAGIAISMQNARLLEDFKRALPDFSVEDNVGSPYCVRRYVVDGHLGGPKGLAAARHALATRGLALILDFVPNHVAPDHPWVAEHPEYFVRGSADDARNDPTSFADIGGTGFARGRDTAKGVEADVDVGFKDVIENLEFTAMGRAQLGYERWALAVDGVYLGLGASKNGVSVDLDELVIEPTLSYRPCVYVEALAGARYVNLHGTLEGPGVLPTPRQPVATIDWADPIVGVVLRWPVLASLTLQVRGDVGGFGAGSEFAWQAFPELAWRFADWGSARLGYRWLSMDYRTGSGRDEFRYDVLTQGPQFGLTVHL